MRAVLKLEVIGDNHLQHKRAIDRGEAPIPHMRQYVKVLQWGQKKMRPWVARITGRDPKYVYRREFIVGMRDYSKANSVGSRGVYEYFALPDGVYEVNERVTWKRTRRYFIRVENAEITEIVREDVERWLENAI